MFAHPVIILDHNPNPIFDLTVDWFWNREAPVMLSEKSYREELEEINRENPFKTGQI